MSDKYNAAYDEAKRLAWRARRSGYPEAEPAWQYCIDGEVGSDNFYTYTVCVYLGKYDPTSQQRHWPFPRFVKFLERTFKAAR